MTVDQAYQNLKNHPNLPSPKGVALEIIRLSRSADRSLSQLARIVETDPAIASRVLRLVNSSAFPHQRPVVSLTEAIAYLGTRTVEGVALGFSLLSARGRCRSFDYVRFWSESLARALAACRLAQSVASCVPDEMFTVGLLCRLGRLVFASTHPDRYDTLLSSIQCGPGELMELERELFGIDHNDLTVRLMADWGLGSAVCRVVALQYEADTPEAGRDPDYSPLASVLALASRIAEHIAAGGQSDSRLDDLLTAAERLGLDAGGLLDIVGHVVAQWREMVGVFDIDEMTQREIRAMYAEAAALSRLIVTGAA